jgi:hypothetical protein
MREQNKGFSESKLENKKYKINAIGINIKAKNNSEDNTMKITKNRHYMRRCFGAKMVLCALAGLSASLRSAANLPAAAHKTSFLLLIT